MWLPCGLPQRRRGPWTRRGHAGTSTPSRLLLAGRALVTDVGQQRPRPCRGATVHRPIRRLNVTQLAGAAVTGTLRDTRRRRTQRGKDSGHSLASRPSREWCLMSHPNDPSPRGTGSVVGPQGQSSPVSSCSIRSLTGYVWTTLTSPPPPERRG